MAKKNYGKDDVSFYTKFEKPITKESVRDKKMEKTDFDRLKENMKDCRSFARETIEISYRTGLRIDEVAHIRGCDINLENKSLHVIEEGAKNGRARDVNIRDKDVEYFKQLKEKYPDGYLTCICRSLKTICTLR